MVLSNPIRKLAKIQKLLKLNNVILSRNIIWFEGCIFEKVSANFAE